MKGIFRWIFGRKGSAKTNPFILLLRKFFSGLNKSLVKFFKNIQPALIILKDDSFIAGRVLFEVLRIFIKDSIKTGGKHFVYNLDKYLLNNDRALNHCATFIIILLVLMIILEVLRRGKKKK